jgi:hypothetical protein
MKLSDELKGKFILDTNCLNKIVNIGGGPIVNLETIDLKTATYWYKAGKLPMLKADKKAEIAVTQ